MKKILFALLMLAAVPTFAVDIITATISVTNAPLGNTNTITVSGSTRTFTNDVSQAPGTLIQETNSIPYSATNIWLHFGQYKASAGHTYLSGSASNQMRIRGFAAEALSVSISAGWGTVTFVTNTITTPTFTVRVPYTVEAATNQTNIASMLVDYISNVSTQYFATNATALSNYFTRSTAQTGGNKIITNSLLHLGGLTAATNISGNMTLMTNGYWTNGFANNLTVTNLAAPGSGTNSVLIHSVAFTATAGGENAISIGHGTAADGLYAISIGANATAPGPGDVVIGNSAEGGYGNDVVIGTGASVNATNQIVIGNLALGASGHPNSVVIGNGAQTTASNQFRIGTSTYAVSIPGALEVASVNQMNLAGSITNDAKWSTPATSFTTLGNGNNIAIDFGSNYWIRLDGTITAASAICGIIGGFDGVTYLIENNTGYTVTLAQDTVDPTPANRLVNYTGTDYELVDGGFAQLIYDAGESRWNTIPLYPQTAASTNAVTTIQTNAVDVGSAAARLNFVQGSGVTLLATNVAGLTNTVGISANFTALQLQTNAVAVGSSTNLNLIAGSGVTLLATNISGTNALSISASGSGGWTWAETNVTTYASNTTDTPHIVQPFIGSTNFAWLVAQTNSSRSLSSTQGFGISSNVTQMLAPSGTASSPSYSFSNDPDTGIVNDTANGMSLVTLGSEKLLLRTTGVFLGVNPLYFSSAGDLGLSRDSGGVLNHRNSTTPQTNRVSLSYSDASNNSGLEHGYDVTKGAYFLRSWANGTHTNAPIQFSARPASETNFVAHTNGSTYFFGPVAVMPRTGLTGYSLNVFPTNGLASFRVMMEDSGNVQITNNAALQIGPTPAAITNILAASSTMNFGNVSAQSHEDLPITLAGAADGDVVQIGAASAGWLAGTCYTGFASNGVVFVRFNNYSSSAKDPDELLYKVIVTKTQ